MEKITIPRTPAKYDFEVDRVTVNSDQNPETSTCANLHSIRMNSHRCEIIL